MVLAQPSKNNLRVSPLFWHMLAGAGACLSLPPLFLLPAIFALSVPLLGYIGAQSWREAAAIFAAAGLGWFLASTYWVSNSLLLTQHPTGSYALMALALAMTWPVSGPLQGFVFFFGRNP